MKLSTMRALLFFVAISLLSNFSIAAGFSTTEPNANWKSSKAFIENKGQFRVFGLKQQIPGILFAHDDGNTKIYFTKNGLAFNFVQKSPKKKEHNEGERKFKNEKEFLEEEAEEKAAIVTADLVTMNWEGANLNAKLIPIGNQEAYHNYSFISGGKEKQVDHLRGYSKLIYKDIYPNIDIEYVFHPENGIKYSIILHPGADPSVIKMKYSDNVALLANGDINVPTLFGKIVDHAPVSFYADDENAKVNTQFVKNGRTISFNLASYDANKTLIIDPWVMTPSLPNSNKVWECESDNSNNAYAYGGDSFIKLLKYNNLGVNQWTYTSPWDSANYWIGGFITHPLGDSYMTTGTSGQLRKINTAGTFQWNNSSTAGLTSYEYWSLAFNCDLTQLVIGGSRSTFSIPFPVIRGTIMNINLTTGAILSTTVAGYGAITGIPPNIQEVSSICMAPNGNFYGLTLDTVFKINNALNTIGFKTLTGYNFDYYIPGYGFGTKQPISCIRANSAAVYTQNGATLHKRDLNTGAITATAAIPGGINTATFFGDRINGNGGLDIDNCGNVYVGSGNAVVKYDANLNFVSSSPTTYAVYDVDVNSNGEVIACGFSGGVGRVESVNLSACAQLAYVCVTCAPIPVAMSNVQNASCAGVNNGSATATPTGAGPFTYTWSPSGGNAQTATNLAPGNYTVTVSDGTACTGTQTVTIAAAAGVTATVTPTNALCANGTGSATANPSGGGGTYSYTWTPSGGNAQTATGLSAGPYSVTVNDQNGCTTTQTVTITAPAIVDPGITNVTPPTCNGLSTGSATVTATGGTGVITYSWTPIGTTGNTATNLQAGTYTVIATDQNNCTGVTSFTLTQPAAITSTVTATTNVTCNGLANGSATVTASGGTGTIGYVWSPSGGNSSSASGLGQNTYTVTMTDQNNCVATQTVSITEPTALTATLTATTNVSCNGQANGTATVTATGGTGALTYSWTPSGGTSATAFGLGQGTYTLTTTDQNNCTTTTTVTITEPAAISATTTVTPASCGLNDGSISATGSGGAGALTYVWLPSGTVGSTLSNVGVGTYSLVVTDASLCSYTTTAIVGTLNGPVVTAAGTSSVSCNGGSNGTGSVNITGGTGTITYTWTPSGGNSASATNLSAGTYTVIAMDQAGCVGTETLTITEPTAITNTVTSSPSACLGSTGTATVTANGGTGTYTYIWQPGSAVGATVTGLAPGNYTVGILDGNNCVSTGTTTVGTVNGPTVTVQSQSDATCNATATGSITLQSTGGTGAMTYSWTPNVSSSATATNIAAGTYSVLITDAAGCTTTQSITIAEPSAITMASTIGSDTLCAGQSTTLNALATGGTGTITYNWTGVGVGANQNITPAFTNTYVVTATDANNCQIVQSVSVTVVPLPTVTAGPSATICGNNTATLIAGGTSGLTYSWAPSGGLNTTVGDTVVASPSSTTNYTVVGTNAKGCSSSATATVTVDNSFNVSLSASPNNGYAPLIVNLTNTSTGTGTFNWVIGNGNVFTGNTPPAQEFPNAGFYNVILYGISAAGCPDSAFVLVVVDEDFSAVIPNIFSPNNDNINEEFMIKLKGVKTAECLIYDRWGILMAKFDPLTQAWNGKTLKDKDCPEGQYYYILTAIKVKGEETKLQGYLMLVR